MNPERWKQVRDIFDEVVEMDPVERNRHLLVSTDGDPGLRHEVEELLRSYDESDDIMDRPAADGLGDLLSSGPTPRAAGTSPFSGSVLGGATASGAPLRGTPSDYTFTGHHVGSFRLVRKIGAGGMGSVYEALRDDHAFQQRVAIKFVKPGMGASGILQRFLTERQVLAGLNHPNIARLLDGGTTPDGLPYFVMEYVDGTPIDRYCDEQRLNIAQRLALFRTVCEAVQYAHQNLIVHRDLKPANILVTPSGAVKLLDFGIAKLLGPAVGEETIAHTTDGSPMTPEFASPEQVQGETVTTASDIYALGVLLYQLLTGRSPYRLDSWTAPKLFIAIAEQQPERPSERVLADEETIAGSGEKRVVQATLAALAREGTPDRLHRRLSGDLDIIVLTALRKEPARRYASVERFSDDLRRFLEGHPISARPDTLSYRAAKFTQRHRAGVAAVALGLLALFGATIVSLYYARAARQEQLVADRRFQDVRQLARFVMFEFDDAIRAGETPARIMLVKRAFEYLNGLSKEAMGDVSLEREVAQAYLKLGDIQGNLYTSHVGDREGALESHRRALDMANLLAGRPSPEPADLVLVIRAKTGLGDLQALGGDRRDALRLYQEARAEAEALDRRGRTPETIQQLAEVVAKEGFVQSQLGNLKTAREDFQRALRLATDWQRLDSNNPLAQRCIAMATSRLGELLVRSGNSAEGLVALRRGAVLYEDLVRAQPGVTSHTRDLAATSILYGDALLSAHHTGEAVSAYRRALHIAEGLSAGDPKNQQYQRDLHLALGRLADALSSAGNHQEARLMTSRALGVLKPLVDLPSPSAYDIQQYVWLLVTTPYGDLRNPARALPYAQAAARMTNSSDPAVLDALARAYFGAGNKAMAVETERRALALLPSRNAGSVSALRRELEANLERFQK